MRPMQDAQPTAHEFGSHLAPSPNSRDRVALPDPGSWTICSHHCKMNASPLPVDPNTAKVVPQGKDFFRHSHTYQ